MMFRFVFSFACCFISKIVIDKCKLFASDAEKYPGYDMTYNGSESILVKLKMGEYHRKMQIMDALMDPDRSMYEKIRVYLPNYVCGSNVYSGGLLKEWNFDF
jgi:hypothetical protein